jgi:hypothetical protein
MPLPAFGRAMSDRCGGGEGLRRLEKMTPTKSRVLSSQRVAWVVIARARANRPRDAAECSGESLCAVTWIAPIVPRRTTAWWSCRDGGSLPAR